MRLGIEKAYKAEAQSKKKIKLDLNETLVRLKGVNTTGSTPTLPASAHKRASSINRRKTMVTERECCLKTLSFRSFQRDHKMRAMIDRHPLASSLFKLELLRSQHAMSDTTVGAGAAEAALWSLSRTSSHRALAKGQPAVGGRDGFSGNNFDQDGPLWDGPSGKNINHDGFNQSARPLDHIICL